MGADTKIEWADHTFNPWIGCTKVSPACDNCYAETLATARLGVQWGPHAERRRTAESTWRQPLAWDRKARREGRRYRVFCASLADVFDNAVPGAWRCDLWDLIAETPHLDWLLLTKRPGNIAGMLPQRGHGALMGWGAQGYPNVWLGTTVEKQAEADRRIPNLLSVPAAKWFLSCEPLLGPINLNQVAPTYRDGELSSFIQSIPDPRDPAPHKRHIGWIIAGGESGPKARPSHPDWFRSLRDQCVSAGVPYFHKQNGEWLPFDMGDDDSWYAQHPVSLPLRWWDGQQWRDAEGGTREGAQWVARIGKRAAGATLDGREWREVPGA